MGFLSGPEIERIIELSKKWNPTSGEIPPQFANGQYIRITPFEPKHVGPNSVDLTLAPKLLIYKKHAPIAFCAFDPLREPEPLDMGIEEETETIDIPPYGFVLRPGVLYLGSTAEWTKTCGLVPCIEGRSSIGRIGLSIHTTAGFGDSFFEGNWTLELAVPFPLRIYPGVRVCQIYYSTLVGEGGVYRGQYQGQKDPKPSGIWKEVSRTLRESDGDAGR